MKSKLLVRLLSLVVLAVLIAGCASNSRSGNSPSSSPSSSGSPPAASESPADKGESNPQKIRMAVLPYLDYTLFVAAKELGVDKEQGIELDLIPFPHESQAVQALLNGSIDVAQGALGSFVPLLPNAPELRVVLNNNQFKGFVYIGREGKIKSFDDLLQEKNGNFEEAQKATLQQLKGKTFLMVESSFGGMLSSALKKVGLNYSDVKVMNFQNDAQAATAFLRGEGDLYTGSVPQQMKILKEPGYIEVAGNEVLGEAGLWFSNTAVTDQYLKTNKKTLEKLAAIHYRMTRYLKEDPETVLQPMLEFLNKNASSNLTMDDAKVMVSNYIAFNTIEESREGVYSAESPLYWKKAADVFVAQNVELGKIKEGSVDIDTFVQQEIIFNDLLANAELKEWINAPFN